MIRTGSIHTSDLITHVLPLRQVGEAFEVAIDTRRGELKVVVTCQGAPLTTT